MKDKKLPTIKCPTCKEEITREDLGYSQEGTMIFDLSFDEKGNAIFGQDEFLAVDSGTFYHPDCNGELGEEEIDKLEIKL